MVQYYYIRPAMNSIAQTFETVAHANYWSTVMMHGIYSIMDMFSEYRKEYARAYSGPEYEPKLRDIESTVETALAIIDHLD